MAGEETEYHLVGSPEELWPKFGIWLTSNSRMHYFVNIYTTVSIIHYELEK